MTTKQEIATFQQGMSARVETVRGAAGWTQEETAKSLGMALSTYRSKVDGRSHFTPGEAAVLERAFRLPEGALFSRSDYISVPVRRISDAASVQGVPA